MKTAIYIEDGVVQLVLTPESKFEVNALTTFKDKPLAVRVYEGAFYRCQGGWNRHIEYPGNQDHSLILRIDEVGNDNPS